MNLDRDSLLVLRRARNILYGSQQTHEDVAADYLRRADSILFPNNPYRNDHDYYVRRYREIAGK